MCYLQLVMAQSLIWITACGGLENQYKRSDMPNSVIIFRQLVAELKQDRMLNTGAIWKLAQQGNFANGI